MEDAVPGDEEEEQGSRVMDRGQQRCAGAAKTASMAPTRTTDRTSECMEPEKSLMNKQRQATVCVNGEPKLRSQ
eukprot:6220266-Pyramimonas_sp.AAC.1